MDTSLTVKNMRRQSWALMLREQSASGLSIKDWCEQNNLSTKSFYYRRRQVQSMILDSAEESRFTELVMPEPSVPNTDPKRNVSAGMFTPQLKVRVNTIGLANLMYGKDITPLFEGRVDTLSISLNAPDEEEFLSLTRSKFGIESYEAIKKFAVLSKQYVPNVVMTVVEGVMTEEKINLCRKVCEDLGVSLRVRKYEE